MSFLNDRVPSPEKLGVPKEVLPLIVAAVRAILSKGLPDDTIRAGVRVTGFEQYGGGMKSPLVGGLSVHFGLTLKIGTREIEQCQALFTAANSTGSQVFPNAHLVMPLPGGEGRRLMIMDHLRGYRPLLEVAYKHDVSPRLVVLATRRCLEHLDRIHALPGSVTRSTRSGVGTLYVQRLRTALTELGNTYPWLAQARERGLSIQRGLVWRDVLPLDELVAFLAERIRVGSKAPVTLHGDPHLGNLMARRYGQGYASRLIDPNPTWGVGDYLYDSGKLFHFADACGPARLWPARVAVPLIRQHGKQKLGAPVFTPPLSSALLARQKALLTTLREWRARRAEAAAEPPDGPRWHMSVATATLVTAANIEGENAVRALVHCGISHLVEARDRISTRGLGQDEYTY